MSAAASVRLGSVTDRPALLDLWEEAWSAARPDIDFEARRAWMAKRLDDCDRLGTAIVLGQDEAGAIAGFITVDPATGQLDQLAVRLSLQGQGWGNTLIEEAKRLSPSGLDLSVNQTNHRAIRLYWREGFVMRAAGVNARSGQPIWHMRWNGLDVSGRVCTV